MTVGDDKFLRWIIRLPVQVICVPRKADNPEASHRLEIAGIEGVEG